MPVWTKAAGCGKFSTAQKQKYLSYIANQNHVGWDSIYSIKHFHDIIKFSFGKYVITLVS